MNMKADITLPNGTAYPVTFNDYALVDKMLPSLQEAAGKENTKLTIAHTGAEDFALFSEVVPGFYFFLGGMPKGEDPKKAPAHHTPDFFIDESGLVLGVKAFTAMAVDYLDAKK